MADFNAIRFQPSRPLLKEVSAERLNAILTEIKRNKPVGERGITVRQSGDRTYIGLAAKMTGGTSTPATTRPFQLSTVNEGTSEDPDWKVRVLPSTLAGGSSTDLGFALADDPAYLLTAEEGIVQGGITIDETGEITSRWLEIVEELSADTNTEFHVEIGSVQELEDGGFDVTNSRYGPIDANVCRNWFSNPPTYSVTFFEGVQ
jgi:hypothetical protein